MSRHDPYPLFQDIRSALAPAEVQAAMQLRIETEHHFLELHLFNHHRLVVTFEDARDPGARPDPHRQGWGVAPFLARGASVLAVKPKACDWYVHDDLPEAFARMRGFFASFGQVIHYGNSMGGFAALTFADLNGAARVVAIAPQSTYREINGKLDPRFPAIEGFDHSGPWGDAVEGSRKVAQTWLLYDRMEVHDRRHARRIRGPDVRHLRVPFAAHGVPEVLKAAGLLHVPVELCLHGRTDQTDFYRKLRARRNLPSYGAFLRVVASGHPNVARRLEKAAALGLFADPGESDAAFPA